MLRLIVSVSLFALAGCAVLPPPIEPVAVVQARPVVVAKKPVARRVVAPKPAPASKPAPVMTDQGGGGGSQASEGWDGG